MSEAFAKMGWCVLFILVGGVEGVAVLVLAAAILPRLIDRMTPAIDEKKKIAAAVLGGILAPLRYVFPCRKTSLGCCRELTTGNSQAASIAALRSSII